MLKSVNTPNDHRADDSPMKIILVVGLGNIGLPLASQLATRGHQGIRADVNRRVVDQVNRGGQSLPGEAHLGSTRATAARDGG
jgi:UDP-N-acetyl-D-mannosaminuronate dehydrogenase